MQVILLKSMTLYLSQYQINKSLIYQFIMNPMDLKCRMVDHFESNKSIEGICVDEGCTSTQRLWCIMCLKKYHSKCSRDSFLTKEEIMEQIKKKLCDLKQHQQAPEMESFRVLKEQIIKELDLLEKCIRKKSLNQHEAGIQQIEEILRSPHSTKLLTDSYDLLQIQVNSQQFGNLSPMIKCLEEVLQTIKSLEQHGQKPISRGIVEKQQEIKQTQLNYFIKDQILEIKMPSLVYSIDCSPDDRFVSCASTDKIIIYDLQWSKQFGTTLNGHTRDIYCVRQMISGGADHTIRIWNFKNFTQSEIFLGHKEAVYSIDYSPDGKYIVSGSQDNSIRIWNLMRLEFVTGHRNTPVCVRYSLDGLKIVSGSSDKSVRIWNSTTGEQLILAQTGQRVLSVAFSPDSKFIISSGEDKTLQLWCARTGKLLETLDGHTDYIWSVRFSRNGKYVLSGCGDKTIRRTPFLPQ